MIRLEADNPFPSVLPTLGVWENVIEDGRKLTLVSCAFPDVPYFVCDAWTYEGSPSLLDLRKLSLGRIELIHLVSETPRVTLITTVTPEPGAVEFLARMEGAEDTLHPLLPPNLCWQLWRAPGFASKPDTYSDFVSRCFLYTETGPTRLDRTVRLPIPLRRADEPCNNPPWVQSYLSVNETPPVDPESGFAGYSPTRYVYPVIGTVSRDERYLAAIASSKSIMLCQAWHDCLHNVPDWTPADAVPSQRVSRMKIYAMANDPQALLERVLADFPELPRQADLEENSKRAPYSVRLSEVEGLQHRPFQYISLSPGQFTMGASVSETGSYPDEGPSHAVTLTTGFSMGVNVVTQGQWMAIMGTRPWEGDALAQDHPDCPAVCVSWSDVQQFLARLSQREGALCRLPTEAEWEYACRAGTTGRWSFGDEEEQLAEYGWFFWNAWHKELFQPRPVGTRHPNPWGFHDFHGNVWEWCLDWYGPYEAAPQTDPHGPSTGIYRVVRGGDLMRGSWDLRSAARAVYLPDSRGSLIGFRVVKES